MHNIALVGVATAVLASNASAQFYAWAVSDTGDADGVIEPGEIAVIELEAAFGPYSSFAHSRFDVLGVEGWAGGEVISQELWQCGEELGQIGDVQPNNDLLGVTNFQLPALFTCGCCGNPENPTPQLIVEWRPDDYFDRQVVIDLANFIDWNGEPDRMNYYTDDHGTSNAVAPEYAPLVFSVACAADINDDRSVDAGDLTEFIHRYMDADGSLDWDGNGVLDTRDFIAFLGDWAIGCD